ncbi:MAG: hypothetical protein P1U36_02005 [Legionellaceae bacterium]|nr:hypothetical protein [Legionellaceae bacterium]
MFSETALFQELILSIGIGFYMLSMVVILFLRADYYRSLIAHIEEPGVIAMVTAMFSLFMALFLILLNNVWVFDTRIFVTVLCWMFLFNSVLWLAVPVLMLDLLKKVCSSNGYYVVLGVMFIFAAQILTRVAYFYLHHHEIITQVS